MMCSAYFGELCEERKKDWNYKNTDPYSVLKTFVKLVRKGHELLYSGQDYFKDKIQIDWGSFAWKCTKEEMIKFLEDKQSTLPWLIESELEIIECVKQYIEEHGDTLYGVVFIEEY